MTETAVKKPPPLMPNSVALNFDATSSTFATMRAAHSVVTGSNWFNSLFHNSNFESTSFNSCEFNGAMFEGCTLRGVEFRNCDVEGLIINGVRVGALLKLFHLEEK